MRVFKTSSVSECVYVCVSISSYDSFVVVVVVVVVVKKTRHSNGIIGLRNNRPHVTFRREGANTPLFSITSYVLRHFIDLRLKTTPCCFMVSLS